MTGDAELLTGDPRWHNFLPGTSPLGLFFTRVEASAALTRVVAHKSLSDSCTRVSLEIDIAVGECLIDAMRACSIV